MGIKNICVRTKNNLQKIWHFDKQMLFLPTVKYVFLRESCNCDLRYQNCHDIFLKNLN